MDTGILIWCTKWSILHRGSDQIDRHLYPTPHRCLNPTSSCCCLKSARWQWSLTRESASHFRSTSKGRDPHGCSMLIRTWVCNCIGVQRCVVYIEPPATDFVVNCSISHKTDRKWTVVAGELGEGGGRGEGSKVWLYQHKRVLWCQLQFRKNVFCWHFNLLSV